MTKKETNIALILKFNQPVLIKHLIQASISGNPVLPVFQSLISFLSLEYFKLSYPTFIFLNSYSHSTKFLNKVTSPLNLVIIPLKALLFFV